MDVLGIDLALNVSGWALIAADAGNEAVSVWGTIITSGRTRGEKLLDLLTQTRALLGAQPADLIVVERPHRWARAKTETSSATLEALAEALGVAQVAVAEHQQTRPCELMLVDPSVAKLGIVGRDRAGKGDVRRHLRWQGFDVAGMTDDESDALAIAVVGARTWHLNGRLWAAG